MRPEELQAEVQALRTRLAQLETHMGQVLGRREPLPETIEVLLVRIATTKAAFELVRVSEVVPAAELVPVPEAPTWMLGMLNLRGATVPVLDVAARLDGHAPAYSVGDLIVIAALPGAVAGFVVAEVGAIRSVAKAALETSVLQTPHAPYVLGTFNSDAESTLLLGLEELLRHSELSPQTREAEPT